LGDEGAALGAGRGWNNANVVPGGTKSGQTLVLGHRSRSNGAKVIIKPPARRRERQDQCVFFADNV
jgi:hypothetical protein